VRLNKIAPEFKGQVRLRERPFPLEVFGGGPPDRHELGQEWWLAALQEPAADFAPYRSDDWPTTTLPAFEAAWCAFQQGAEIGHDYDLRIRRAFFYESRNIGKRDVLLEIAREAGLDMDSFTRMFDSGEAHKPVLDEGRLGYERYRVHGTPTVMLEDGARLHHPMAFPVMENDRVVKVGALPCCGETCLEMTRNLFVKALQWGQENQRRI
jgi:predicted DsbA family dithiol-disulfide isomerase